MKTKGFNLSNNNSNCKKYEDEWLIIKEEKPKKKTKVFSVWSKCSNLKLGEVKWYSAWRHYCFIGEDAVYSDRCLLNMGQFVKNLNGSHNRRR